VAQPSYITELSRDISAVEESTEIQHELRKARTAQDVRDVLEAHRRFYLSMSVVERTSFNNVVKKLFETLPLSARLP
jgi:hypothetical protein